MCDQISSSDIYQGDRLNDFSSTGESSDFEPKASEQNSSVEKNRSFGAEIESPQAQSRKSMKDSVRAKRERGGWSGGQVVGLVFIFLLGLGITALLSWAFTVAIGPAAWFMGGFFALMQLAYFIWLFVGQRPEWDGNAMHVLWLVAVWELLVLQLLHLVFQGIAALMNLIFD